ncbi:hypothetical protein XU18_3666 [Perkinsela sp. CCAP 1560/4]|nr:hypothetical protein XU18_3666 [Perkinsela sp. CCAP 1560/4]|eukprot:KNH05262.1 hypothetical protein XU18_3666 [Perkinsela sp. CCAP 1560/4]
MKRKEFPVQRKVDAITNERIGEKSIAIPVGNSGDVLFYNTSTLIRIAEEYGKFMQPPYFREAAREELINEISKIEGRLIVISKKRRREGEGVSGGVGDPATGVQHQMEGFNDFMNSHHEPLSPKNFYYCPVCYAKSMDNYVNELKNNGDKIQVGEADEGADREECSYNMKDAIDPLDVFSMIDAKGGLNTVLFAKAKDWKDHIYKHHYISCTPTDSEILKPNALFSKLQLLAGDYSVRMNINAYISKFNHHLGLQQMYHRIHGTTKQYWHCDAHFNVFRYNRLVDSIIRSEPDLQHSICVGDSKCILGDPDASNETDSSVESSVDSSAESASSQSSSDEKGRDKAEFADRESKELLEIAKYYTKRAKREKYLVSDEGSISSEILSETSASESDRTSEDSKDGPLSTFFSMGRGKLTQHERHEMEKMALKEEGLRVPVSGDMSVQPREALLFSAKQSRSTPIREELFQDQHARDERTPISPTDKSPHALIYDTE